MDFMVDILQQKGERENKTKPQINLQATGECNAQILEGASPSELPKGHQNQTRRGYGELTSSTKHRGCSLRRSECKGLACSTHPMATKAAEQAPIRGSTFKAKIKRLPKLMGQEEALHLGREGQPVGCWEARPRTRSCGTDRSWSRKDAV